MELRASSAAASRRMVCPTRIAGSGDLCCRRGRLPRALSQARRLCPGLTISRAKPKFRIQRSASCIRSRQTTAPFSPDPASGCNGGEASGGSARSRSAICLAGSGLENRKPCISSQAWLRRKVSCSSGLDALRNDGHAERLAHADDRLRDGLVFGIDRQVANEGAIDLDGVDRELLHQRHRRIAGSEIVDRKANAAALDRIQHLDRARDVAHHHALGDFELQQHRRHAAVPAAPRRHLAADADRRIAAATG